MLFGYDAVIFVIVPAGAATVGADVNVPSVKVIVIVVGVPSAI